MFNNFVVSDTCSSGATVDKSGPNLKKLLRENTR